MKKVCKLLLALLVLSIAVVALAVNVSAASNMSWTPDTVKLTGAKATGTTSIALQWETTTNYGNNHGYKIYRSTSKNGTYQEVGTVYSWYATGYTDYNLTTGNTYYYKVCQFNSFYPDQNGEFSNIKSATPGPAEVTFSATAYEKNQISLYWSRPTESVDGYVIYRATSKNGTYKAIKRIKDGNTTFYVDTGVSHGKFYYYKIKSFATIKGKVVYSAANNPVRNKVDVKLCRAYFTKIGNISTNESEYMKLIQVKYGNKTLISGVDYYGYNGGMGYSGDTLNYVYYTVSSVYNSDFIGSYRFHINTISEQPSMWDPTVTNSGISISWRQMGGLGYKIYRKTGSGSFTCVKTITDSEVTEWVDKTQKAGKTYQYYIKAYTEKSGKNVYSKASVTKSIKRIGMPKLKSITNKKSGIAISWSAVKGAASYNVLRKTGKGGWEFLLNTTDTQYVDDSTTVGTVYTYTVYSCSGVGNWNSKQISYYDPKGLQAERLATSEGQSISTSSVKLTWNKATKATGYVIYRATSAKGTYKKIKTISNKNTCTFTDSKLTFGKYYYYRVRPYTVKNGKTTYGSYGTTLKIRPTVGIATQKKVKLSAYNKVTVSWQKVAKADGYQIYQASSENGTYKKVKTVTGGNTLSATVSKLENGETYYFKVRAYRKSKGTTYYGDYSKIKSCLMDKLGYAAESYESRVKRIWGGTEYKGYTTSSAAKKDMKTIKIKTWDINAKGKKYTRYHYLTVHKNIAPTVQKIFEEIYNGKEKFPIKDVASYSWRGNGIYSQHGAGLAIDINPRENAQFNGDTGKAITGSYWKPGKDPYSITPNGDVVRAFEKYGYGWGNWFYDPDYMHFSYFGT